MSTLESIMEKLGYDPFIHEYRSDEFGGDDTDVWGPFDNLSDEELNFILDGFKRQAMDKVYVKELHTA